MSFKETDFPGKLFPNIWIIFHINCLKMEELIKLLSF